MPTSHLHTAPLSKSIPLTALIAVLVLGALLLSTLYWQLSRLAENQQNLLGNTLAGLLSESVQQPLLNDNKISLQVVLDRLLADSPQVARASVLDINNRLITQAQRSTQSPLESFTHPVTMENAIAGYIRVELASQVVKAPYLTPFWFALGLWLLFWIPALFWLQRQTTKLCQRLLKLGDALPEAPEEPDNLSELEIVETRIAPLLSPSSTQHEEAIEATQACTLTVLCHNLPRLKAQLTHENIQSLLHQLDLALAKTCTLYDGERLPGNGDCGYIRFSAVTSDATSSDQGNYPLESDYALRALCCGQALLNLCRDWANDQGIPLQISAALSIYQPPAGQTPWLRDMHLAEHLQQTAKTAELAAPWQIVLDEEINNHNAISECAGTEALPAADKIHQLISLSAPQQTLLERQVQYLHTQLQPQ